MEGTAGRAALLRFCAAALLFWASLYVYVPTLAPYAQVLGASLSVIGLILAAYGFTQFALRIPLGLWADRRGRCRPFILAGFFLALASGLGLALAPGAGVLLLFRGLAGTAAASWVAKACTAFGCVAASCSSWRLPRLASASSPLVTMSSCSCLTPSSLSLRSASRV